MHNYHEKCITLITTKPSFLILILFSRNNIEMCKRQPRNLWPDHRRLTTDLMTLTKIHVCIFLLSFKNF